MRQRLAEALAFASVFAFLAWTRLSLLEVSFWNDEAFTALHFVNPGPGAIFGDHYRPNNHVLFSLLSWPTTQLLGRTELVYRLWSVIPSLGAAALITAWARWRFDFITALALLILIATSPIHLDLSIQARGYGLGFLAMAGVLVAAIGWDKKQSPNLIWVGAAATIGIWTLPVFVLPFLSVALVLIADRGPRQIAAMVGIVGVLSLAFYAPLLLQIVEASGQKFGEPVEWLDFIWGPYRDLFANSGYSPATAKTAATALWLCLGLGVWRLGREGQLWVAARLVAPILGTYLGLAALQLYAAPRFFSYLLLPATALAAIGVGGINQWTQNGPGSWMKLPTRLVLLTIALGLGVLTYEETLYQARVPLEAYREALDIVRPSGRQRVYTNSRFNVGFDFYAAPLEMHYPAEAELQEVICNIEEPAAYIHYPLYGRTVDLQCLLDRSYTPIAVPQRAGGSAGSMQVWFVGH